MLPDIYYKCIFPIMTLAWNRNPLKRAFNYHCVTNIVINNHTICAVTFSIGVWLKKSIKNILNGTKIHFTKQLLFYMVNVVTITKIIVSPNVIEIIKKDPMQWYLSRKLYHYIINLWFSGVIWRCGLMTPIRCQAINQHNANLLWISPLKQTAVKLYSKYNKSYSGKGHLKMC